MIGRTIGKYRIVGQLGRGGMGTVYKAIDETLDREVAIKVLNPELADTDIMKRFRAEATTLAKLNHPEIATIYELFRSETDLLMVMEFVRGETLDKISERLGPMAPERAAFLIDKVLSALEHAHRAGIVHRDMKPANVMVTDIGGVKIMDFGIARVRGAEHMTVDGYMMGTPAYMPPEQVLGQEVDGRADLYSVGVVFYRLLTGALPFKADTAIGMVQKQISDTPTPLNTHRPGLPDWCEIVLLRALAKSPADRFQTAEDFRSAISHATGMSVSIEHAKAFAISDVEATTPPQPIVLEKLGLTPAGLSHAAARTPGAAVAVSTPLPAPLAASPFAAASSVGGVAPVDASSPMATPRAPVSVPAAPKSSAAASSVDGATIVLRKQHFAIAGSLLTVLALGVAVLAYAALRRPVTPAVSSATSAQANAPAPPMPTPASNPDTTTASNPAVIPTTTGGAATPAATPGTASAVPAGATATTAPGTKPSGPSGPSAGAGPAAIATPGSAAPATGRGNAPITPSTTTASATAAVGTTTKPASASAPTRAVTQPITFEVKAIVGADNRTRERDARLILAEGKVTVTADDNQDSIHSVPYENVLSIYYSTGKDPQWNSPEGPATVARAGSGFLGIRGDRYWVSLRTKDTKEPFVVLRFLNLGAARSGVKAIEDRTGHIVDIVLERKDAK